MSFVWKRPEGRLRTPEQVAREVHEVSLELGLDEFATVLAVMCIAQESDFWCPWNRKDPSSQMYPHDSESDDGRSVAYLQQQNSRAGEHFSDWWGDMACRMDLKCSVRMFLERLTDNYRDAHDNPALASQFIQNVQRSAYPDAYAKHWNRAWQLVRGLSGTPDPPAPPATPPADYGMPPGTDIRQGAPGFPAWVYQLGNAFGLQASTYKGHQETDRKEAGFAPNPQRLNRGIDWWGSVENMQRFADYCMSIKHALEQVIWENPHTGKRIGVAGGSDVTHSPYYDYDGGYNVHRDHVHTRQSRALPVPGGAPAPAPLRPQFEERAMFGWGGSKRSRKPMNFFIHTQEGSWDATAEDLAVICQGQNNVSYHYTIRDRIVYDVVDTDLYSWSVLDANVFSINLCFAGSSVTQTRQQWLDRYGRDIDIAAYLAVQDARKYGFSTEVLVPHWGKQGSDVYAGNPRAGISDHNYVTRELGIGNHTDVGQNFPWDVFVAHVNKYASQQEDELSAEAERLIRDMSTKVDKLFAEYTPDRRAPTRSLFGIDLSGVESPLGFLWNMDGNIWTMQLTWAYLFGVSRAVQFVHRVAEQGVSPASWAGQLTDEEGHWLAEFGQQYCLGLIAFRERLQAVLLKTDGPKTSMPAVSDYKLELQLLEQVQDEKFRLEQENRILREELRARSAQPSAELVQAGPSTTGEIIGRAYDALQELRLADALPIEERAPLAALISVLQTKNGSEIR